MFPQRENKEAPAQPEGAVRTVLMRAGAALAVGMLLLLALALFLAAGNVLLLLFSGVLLAILLRDTGDHLVKWLRLPGAFGVPLVLALAVIVIGATGWLLAPRIAEQTDQLMTAVPESLRRLRQNVEHYGWARELMSGMPAPSNLFPDSSALLSRISTVFSGAFGIAGNFLIVLFVGIYFAAQPRAYVNGAVRLLPQHARNRGREVLGEIGKTLRLWMRGKVISMAIIGVLTTIGLMLLGVPLSLTIGLLAGVLDFIPYIGPVIAAVPAVLVALAQDPMLALYVVLLFVGLQSVEGYLLLPLVERRTVSLLPGLIIAMQVLFGLAFGLIGVALATPVTAAAIVVIGMLYVQDTLGDDVKLPADH